MAKDGNDSPSSHHKEGLANIPQGFANNISFGKLIVLVIIMSGIISFVALGFINLVDEVKL